MILITLMWARFPSGADNFKRVKPGFHNSANATTTTQKQSDYKVEQSSFKLIALF